MAMADVATVIAEKRFKRVRVSAAKVAERNELRNGQADFLADTNYWLGYAEAADLIPVGSASLKPAMDLVDGSMILLIGHDTLDVAPDGDEDNLPEVSIS